MIIDVSSNNPETLPDWCTGVIIKQTQGLTYTNPYLYPQIDQCRARGIPYATYHYLQSVSAQELTRAVNFYKALSGPEFLMLDFSRLVNMGSIAYIGSIDGLSPYAYCNQSQLAAVKKAGLKVGLANWALNEASAAEYLSANAEAENLFGIQYTNNYQGYDAWVTLPGILGTPAEAPGDPTPEPASEGDNVQVHTVTWPTGANGEGWVKLNFPGTLAGVYPLSSHDPSASADEVTWYPRLVVTPLGDEFVVSWTNAEPSVDLALCVAMAGA